MSIVTDFNWKSREGGRPRSESLVHTSNREGTAPSRLREVVGSRNLIEKPHSPERVLYPNTGHTPKPLLSPYASLNPSPVRRIRGLATLNLYRPEYNKIR